VGIVRTDAQLMGGMSTAGMQMRRIEKHALIDELSKQYEVEEVNLEAPVARGVYDALIVVQPSSLAPPQFERLIEAVKSGVPTAIFEDPLPFGRPDITPTGEPKQQAGGMFGMGGGQQQPKGDIRELWDVLELKSPGKPGVQFFNSDVVWQAHNPYPNIETNSDLCWIFVDENAKDVEPGQALVSDSPISAGLRQVLALYAGAIEPTDNPTLKHTPLLRTAPESGTIDWMNLQQAMRSRDGSLSDAIDGNQPGQVLAMTIEGSVPAKEESDGAGTDDAIKVAYIADTDLMLDVFLQIRADPNQAAELRFQFQNVTFLLNTVDWLTGETDFIDVRKHEPIFASLKMIDSVKETASSEVRQKRDEFNEQSKAAINEAEEARDEQLKELREQVAELQRKNAGGSIPKPILDAKSIEFQTKSERLQRALDVKRAKVEREAERNIAKIQRESDQKVTAIQNRVKAFAVALPCIPPLIVGVIVFASRRLRERENISKSRLK
jgi:ABC-2 type transport system permease protein